MSVPTLVRVSLVILSLVSSSRLAQARQLGSLQDKFHSMAADIKKAAEGRPVAIGQIAPGVGITPDINSGTGLEVDLKRALLSQQVNVQPDAKLTILGDYSLISSRTDQGREIKLLQVSLRLKDEFGKTRKLNAEGEVEVVQTVESIKDTARVVQVSASLPALSANESEFADRRAKLNERIRQPAQVVEGSRVRAEANGQYAIEVLAQANPDAPRLPRPAQLTDGKAFVQLDLEDQYLVRIHNPTDQEVGVALAIDGLDIFHFSQERKADQSPKHSRFVIQPRSHVDLPGWYVRLAAPDNYLSFKVTELGGGARSRELRKNPALKTRCPGGGIHATFARALLPESKDGRTAKGNGAETGFGAPLSVDQEEVERVFDNPHEFIAVCYERP